MNDTDEFSATIPEDIFKVVLDVFDRSFIHTSERVGKYIAKSFSNEIKDRIRHQTFRHQPLKIAYRNRKIKQGLDPRTLIATGEYVNHIRARKINATTYTVGVPNTIHSPSGLPYRSLARIHEFGTDKIPARPHWRPMASIYMARKQRYEKLVEDLLNDKADGELSRTDIRSVAMQGIQMSNYRHPRTQRYVEFPDRETDNEE